MDKRIMASIVVILFVGIVFGYFLIQTEIRTLQDQVVQRGNQIQTLQAQVNDLNESMAQKDSQIQSLQRQVNNLNQSYIDLQREYEDLLFHYNLLNKPVSNFTTVKDLNISIAIDRTIYYYKDPVSGNVTITYLNGTEFRGAFILYILHLTDEGMSTTAGIAIDGFTEFYLSPPVFQFGPGNYTIGISSLSTADGYIIESRWQVFPSVQVEAK
jgi:uncharacterized membrane-anchored protein YhcB (DUF1043 family)